MSYQYSCLYLYERFGKPTEGKKRNYQRPPGYFPPNATEGQDTRPTPKIDQIAMGQQKEKQQQKQEKQQDN